MVTTQLQSKLNGKVHADGLRQGELSPHTLATSIRRMLDWQDRMQKRLSAIREQFELSQWSLFIKPELDEGELDQPAADESTARELLKVAAEFFEVAQASLAAFLRDGMTLASDMHNHHRSEEANAVADIFIG